MSDTLYHNCLLRPTCLITMPIHDNSGRRSRYNPDGLHDIKQEENKTKGNLSVNSVRKMKFALELLIASSLPKKAFNRKTKKHYTFKINFLTLTLSAHHELLTDKDIKYKMLNSFLTQMKQRHGMRSYVWKAELQRNGQLHFHITSDTYLPWESVREVWNRLQAQNGIIALYRRNMQEWHYYGFKPRKDLYKHWPLYAQKRAYATGMKEHWSNPNSTDIHSVQHVNNLTTYMIKYMMKSAYKSEAIEGRIFGCSHNLSGVNKCQFVDMEIPSEDMQRIYQSSQINCIEHDYFTIFPMNPAQFKTHVSGTLLTLWDNYLDSVRDN